MGGAATHEGLMTVFPHPSLSRPWPPGLNSLTALPHVTQLLIAFVSPVRMRF